MFQTGKKFVGKVLWHVENKWFIIYCRTPVKNTFRVFDNFFHWKYYFCYIDIVEYQFIFLSRRTAFNRTKVELKWVRQYYLSHLMFSFNRTKVELKFFFKELIKLICISTFNRTKVELKLRCEGTSLPDASLLIVPKWNWN